MKYKSKAKQLYVEVMRLKYQCSRSKQKTKIQQLSVLDTIEVCNLKHFLQNYFCLSLTNFFRY
jgi:hypothetical protein